MSINEERLAQVKSMMETIQRVITDPEMPEFLREDLERRVENARDLLNDIKL